MLEGGGRRYLVYRSARIELGIGISNGLEYIKIFRVAFTCIYIHIYNQQSIFYYCKENILRIFTGLNFYY